VGTPERTLDRDVTHLWTVVIAGGHARQLTSGLGEHSPRWAPDGERIAYLAPDDQTGRPQIFIVTLAGGDATRLTTASGGVLEFNWSPDGAAIAFVAPVERGPDPSWSGPSDAFPLVTRHLGHKADGIGLTVGREHHLFVVPAAGGEARTLACGYAVAWPSWSPDGKAVAFTGAREGEGDLDFASRLFRVSLDGEVSQLTSGPEVLVSPVWLPGGRSILVVGQAAVADLQPKLLLVPAVGGTPEPVLEGFDCSVLVGTPGYPGAPPRVLDDGSVAFCARVGGCVRAFLLPRREVAPIPLSGDDRTSVEGLSVERRGTIAVAVMTAPDLFGDLYAIEIPAGSRSRLTAMNADWMGEVEVVQPEHRAFAGPDGLAFEGWVWRPASGPSPLLLDIHGGPHNAWGPTLTTGQLYRQVLAGRGWTVLAVNARGSDGYGRAFLDALKGGLGVRDFPDFEAAVDALIADGTVDAGRMAVTGYSYGGYMTAWIVGHTRRFKAAVSGALASDLASAWATSDAATHIGASEMGASPHENPELYRKLSPISYVGQIETPLLIVHGESDRRLDVGQAEQLFAGLRHLRREVEMVRYPGADHLFILRGRPSHRLDYQRRLVDWIVRYCSPSA
jgi:dipeptidyl aminopeptidase/acylaminoacyl peptidase